MIEMMAQILAVFGGSVLGGVCRHLLGSAVKRRLGDGFPYGTLLVNISGAFLAGLFWEKQLGANGVCGEIWSQFLVYGFCGGYTTVSTFSLNTLHLLQRRAWLSAVVNVVGSYVLCLGAVFVGVKLGGGV